MKKNILISSGGSGGHVIPATVIYKHLEKNFNPFLVSDLRGSSFLNTNKYKLTIINTPQIFNSYFLIPFKLFVCLYLICKSFFFLRKNKISKIISTGGYAPIPICLAGVFLKIDLYLYESNFVLGKSNKFFLRYCKKIFCHSKKIKNFPENLKSKIFLITPLIRKVFYKNKKIPKKFILLVIGGSQGAKIFDKHLHKIFVKLIKKKNFIIFHQTKKNNIRYLKRYYDKHQISNKVFNYNKNLIHLIGQCSFCITRAGASTLAELIFLKIPFLTVPFGKSKDNHQYENAKFYLSKNVCWYLDEKNFSKKKLYNILKEVILYKKNFKEKKNAISKYFKNFDWNDQNKKLIKGINEN